MLTFDFNRININPEGTMLDLGCGEGRHIFGVMEKFPDLKCIGLDPHIESLDKAFEGLKFLESISNTKTSFLSGSAYSLPFCDDSFDLVVCSEVLEHLHDYKDAIKEINRVLKPGGQFLASVPAEFPEKICWLLSEAYQNQPGGHLRIFKKNELIKEIAEHNFSFESSQRFHSIHSAYWWLRCLFWKSQESNIIIKGYKKILERHILKKPFFLDSIDKFFNPILGKSIAFYFVKK
ncbi:class I SAM-dependent methyltransferase [Gammaproteobacteria bacterium]|nr:class I SAM-dependent methyltransferase [Gammaproteobacteria bacterium]MDA7857340.1 class I SAM-dependent methyltransferase [Gammaproteobacteria bacterium]MDA8683687.1 class I SAM-dependent methyltransferase [Gammaproteobacteria bacterium]MDA8908413.1 class I SAM-dependent methyltransferase [Gammaproteobacteria bacterium]MDA9045553.1 class I SAM-dependent methyltransferase [Gammaproteobacteria bacterium]|tara:strand:+ start:4126 stop:4830 length:705 start_codon:yes stop_codon:yes gene_type:complete